VCFISFAPRPTTFKHDTRGLFFSVVTKLQPENGLGVLVLVLVPVPLKAPGAAAVEPPMVSIRGTAADSRQALFIEVLRLSLS